MVSTHYARALRAPPRSFFLFGPRGVGKTTWLRSELGRTATWVDLLDPREMVRLARDPGALTREVSALPAGSWVVVDEVQRLPSLLDEVHGLLARSPRRWRFALIGSSARKLRGASANLLAGRVVTRRMDALTSAELGHRVPWRELIATGGLPLVRTERTAEGRRDLLSAYVTTYLAEEVRAEALVRSLESFSRFLGVAALANAQVTNVSALARDAGIARPTVQGHFDVLVDTLLGTWLPAWRPRARVKEVAHPKFYFFDPGVVRALAGKLHDSIDDQERGRLLETWVLHELRAHLAYADVGGELSYWRTPSGSEVDFIWTRGARCVAIEVKASVRWRTNDGDALKSLVRAGTAKNGIAVYAGDRVLRDDELRVLPVEVFLDELERGRILG